jgi:hypothetical protein
LDMCTVICRTALFSESAGTEVFPIGADISYYTDFFPMLSFMDRDSFITETGGNSHCGMTLIARTAEPHS